MCKNDDIRKQYDKIETRNTRYDLPNSFEELDPAAPIVEHTANGPDVHGFIVFLAAQQQLNGSVPQRHHLCHQGQVRLIMVSGQSKVDNLDPVIDPAATGTAPRYEQQDVLRLNVAVNDLDGVQE